MIPTCSTCMHCGRSCSCAPSIFSFLPPRSTAFDRSWDLALVELEEDVQRALRKKWETKLRFLDSIRPANQPRRTSSTAPHTPIFEPRHLAVRATRFRSVARSRPGYRGSTDGKRIRPVPS